MTGAALLLSKQRKHPVQVSPMLVDQVVQADHFASQAILKLTPADLQYLGSNISGQIAQKVGHLMAHQGNPVSFPVASLAASSWSELLCHPVKFKRRGGQSQLKHEIEDSRVLSERLLCEDNVDRPWSEVGQGETGYAEAFVGGKRVLAAAHSGVKNPVQGGGGEQSWSWTSLQKMR